MEQKVRHNPSHFKKGLRDKNTRLKQRVIKVGSTKWSEHIQVINEKAIP